MDAISRQALPVRQTQDRDDLVCHCASVGRRRIQAAIASAPASTLESLGTQLGCGVQCGCCRPLVQDMLGESPWFEVAYAGRYLLTDDPASPRRIVQFDLRLPGYPPYPDALPGQHVVVQAWLDEEWVTRTYTIIDRSADGKCVSIAIRRIADGRFSRRLIDCDDDAFADIPMRIAVPNGTPAPDDGRDTVCFVAGVGVTLALSLLRGHFGRSRLHIDYSAASRGDMAYAEHIETSAAASDTLSCHLRCDDVDGFIGPDDIARTVARFPEARHFVCGPPAYTRHLVEGLRDAGVHEDDIRIEAFFLSRKQRRRTSLRRLAYAAGLALACTPLFLLAPALAKFVPNEAHNPGHVDLACDDCHRPAPGALRQQLQAKTRHVLGLRESDADFGMRPVGNATCIDCHDNPDDRHPAHRFLEPRFEAVRAEFAPHQCVSCHREHTGTRISKVDTGFCASCHADMMMEDDPTQPTHAALIAGRRWDTCLACHDFHGNHAHAPPQRLEQALSAEAIRAYLRDGDSPYGAPLIEARATRSDAADLRTEDAPAEGTRP